MIAPIMIFPHSDSGRNIKVWNKLEAAFRLFRRDCEALEYRITDVKKPLTMRDFATLARSVP